MNGNKTFFLPQKKSLRVFSPGTDDKPGMKELRFIDLFAGIGGFRLGLESTGFYRCVFTSEWDRFAAATYMENFGDRPAGDITEIASDDIPDFDVLVGGFPCQPFSIAGVSKKNALGRKHGFLDETQGTLFFQVARILRDRQPRAFILENVKNLVSHDQGRTFQVILATLKELGYHVHYSVLNARSLVPQNRQRIFLVGFLDAGQAKRFQFPDLEPLKGRPPVIGDILESRVDPRYHLSDKLWNYLQQYREKHRQAGHGFGFGLVEKNGVARTLSARYYKDGSEILIPVRGKNPRRLTPRECARLMGFPESFQIVGSDTQAYRQFGNAVAVPVVERLGQALKEALHPVSAVAVQPQLKNRDRSMQKIIPGKKAAG